MLSTTQDQDSRDLRLAEGSGRPLGTAEFVSGLERLLGRRLTRRARGRKPGAIVSGEQPELLQWVSCRRIRLAAKPGDDCVNSIVHADATIIDPNGKRKSASDISQELNWVKKCAACSVEQIFGGLRPGIESDVWLLTRQSTFRSYRRPEKLVSGGM